MIRSAGKSLVLSITKTTAQAPAPVLRICSVRLQNSIVNGGGLLYLPNSSVSRHPAQVLGPACLLAVGLRRLAGVFGKDMAEVGRAVEADLAGDVGDRVFCAGQQASGSLDTQT